MMLFGSCFSENIGKLMTENLFNVDVNPFGILYNPLSISIAIKRLLRNEMIVADELAFRDGMYHSFLHHGAFSDAESQQCVEKISRRFHPAATSIREVSVFLVTFGTAYAYRLRSTGDIVGNCHKFPGDNFVHARLSIEQIVNEWSEVIETLKEVNPRVKFVFTVSPVRHWKDGAHENTISKSVLHLSIEKLSETFNENVRYFPAYEIVMDELRDYRFYAEDMIHVSDMAVQYIWQRFRNTFFSGETEKILAEWQPILQAFQHRPINTSTQTYRDFMQQTSKKLQQFKQKYPFIIAANEMVLPEIASNTD